MTRRPDIVSRPSLLGVSLDGTRVAAASRDGVYAIFDPSASLKPGVTVDAWSQAVLSSGAAAIQLRVKGATSQERLPWAREILPHCRTHQVALIVNDDVALALELALREGPGRIGVHLGQQDAAALCHRDPQGRWRVELERAGIWVGLSTHNKAQVQDAQANTRAERRSGHEPSNAEVSPSADTPPLASATPLGAIVRPHYLGFGPIFVTQSKLDTQPVAGLEALAQVCELSSLPIVAIGGIQAAQARACRAAGATSVAVISALAGADVDTIAQSVRALS